MRKLFVLLTALCMFAGVFAAASAEGNLIGYTCMDGTNPFFVALEGSIKEVVEAHGDTLISLDPQNSNEKQIAQIEDMISRGVKAMFVNPVDQYIYRERETADGVDSDRMGELIRCRDCKRWNKKDGMFKDIDGRQWHECPHLEIPTDEWFFCKEAKRREDD